MKVNTKRQKNKKKHTKILPKRKFIEVVRMFQNIQYEEVGQEESSKIDIINIIKNIFTTKNILIYTIAFLVSTISLGGEVSPFSIALVGASFSAGIPAFGIIIISIIINNNNSGRFRVYFLATLFLSQWDKIILSLSL